MNACLRVSRLPDVNQSHVFFHIRLGLVFFLDEPLNARLAAVSLAQLFLSFSGPKDQTFVVDDVVAVDVAVDFRRCPRRCSCRLELGRMMD